MATNPPSFVLDKTGTKNSNRKEKEVYSLPTSNNHIRAIPITMGCFFTNTVTIKEKNSSKILKFGVDYIFTEIYSSLTNVFKKEIAATVVIVNPLINDDLEISYNFLGGNFTDTLTELSDSINQDTNNNFGTQIQWDVINKVKPFIPVEYAKQIGEGVGFEMVVFALENLRSTILYGDLNIETTLEQKIDYFIISLNKILSNLIEGYYKTKLETYIAQFTKELLGLGKVVNLGLISEQEAKITAVRDYEFNTSNDGYIVNRTINAFKTELYNNLVNSDTTGIGKHFGVYALPLLETLYSLRNGAGVIINSLETSIIAGYDFNKVVYPTQTSPSDSWSIVKLTNNVSGQGGVLWGTNMTTGELYVGTLRDEMNSVDVLTWVKLYGEYDMDQALKSLIDHTNNIENPHGTNKHQIGLGFVENLPLADYEDLACRVPSEKYVSHKFLLAFMSTYMTGLKTAKDLKEMNCDENEVIRNIKLIFAPCGPCGPCCEPNIIGVSREPDGTPIVDPFGQLTSWFCEEGKRWDIYTDGFGGTITKQHKYVFNDPEQEIDGCSPSTMVTTYEPSTTTTTVAPITTTTTTTTTTEPPVIIDHSVGILLNDSEFGKAPDDDLETNLSLLWNDDAKNKTDNEIWTIVKDVLFDNLP